MIELSLRRTWDEISDYLNSNEPNPLRIAELVNRFPPCNWTFKFTFDGPGRTMVKIDCDSTLSDADARALLDGSLAEVLFADALYLRQEREYFTKDTFQILKDPPSSNLMTLQNLDKKVDSLLLLNGFWQSNSIPPVIQKKQAVRSHFFEHTWLGSPDFTDSEYCIRWIVLGTEELIRPMNRYTTKLKSADSFTAQESLYDTNRKHIGQANFWTTPFLKNDEIYTTFGPLVPKPKNWLSSNREEPRWIVEINSQVLEQAIYQGKPTHKLINELIDSVAVARVSVITSNLFKSYKKDVKWEQQTKAANSLQNRQEGVTRREKVIFKGKPVMLVPSNENEVLVLLCKLEALQALPFHEFILWEYTARTGIDGIATYRMEKIDVSTQFGAIEVEYQYENFLIHEHPPAQANLVICWDFRDVSVPEELKPSKKPYLFECRRNYSYSVLVLSKIPNLEIKRS